MVAKAPQQATESVREIPVTEFDAHAPTQVRATLNKEAIEQYSSQLIEAHDSWLFPAIVAFVINGKLWIVDGWHRLHAAIRANRKTVPTIVKQGSIAEAKRFAIQANREHGVRMTSADRRNAVISALNDSELCNLTQREIAELCGVSRRLVQKIVAERRSSLRAPEAEEAHGAPFSTFDVTKEPEKQPLHQQLPKVGHRLIGKAPAEVVIDIHPHLNGNHHYLTILESASDVAPSVAFTRRAVPHDYVCDGLLCLKPDLDLSVVTWTEVESEPLEGYHELYEPQWLFPDTGILRLNQLEEVIRKRISKPLRVRIAIAEIAEEKLYLRYANSIQDYLNFRFNMDDDEIARLTSNPANAN